MNPLPHPGRRPKPGADSSARGPSLFRMELSRNLRTESVDRLRPTPPRAVDAGLPVAAAVAAMRQWNVGCLLVTRGGRLAGVFTDRDLLARVLAAGLPMSTPVCECMTSDPVTIGPRDTVRTAIRRMEKGGYRHLPVVDDANRPVGILSVRRVVQYLAEHFPGLVYNQPPDPNRYPDSEHGG